MCTFLIWFDFFFQMAFFISMKAVVENEPNSFVESFKATFDSMALGTISLPINIPGTQYYRGLKVCMFIIFTYCQLRFSEMVHHLNCAWLQHQYFWSLYDCIPIALVTFICNFLNIKGFERKKLQMWQQYKSNFYSFLHCTSSSHRSTFVDYRLGKKWLQC